MGMYYVLLLALVAAFTISDTMSVAAESAQSEPLMAVNNEVNARKSLRSVEGYGAKAERALAGGLSITAVGETAAKATSKISSNIRTRIAIAMKKFEATGWLAKGMPSSEVRAQLGLGGLSLEAAKQTKEFKIYARYVNDFDETVEIAALHGWDFPRYISKVVSKEEVAARAEIWYNRGKSAADVLKVLGLRNVSEEKLTSSSFYKYYEAFQQKLRDGKYLAGKKHF